MIEQRAEVHLQPGDDIIRHRLAGLVVPKLAVAGPLGAVPEQAPELSPADEHPLVDELVVGPRNERQRDLDRHPVGRPRLAKPLRQASDSVDPSCALLELCGVPREVVMDDPSAKPALWPSM